MNKPVMTVKDLVKEALAAESRIRPCIRETPLEYSPYLSNLGDCRAYLKLENIQITGSFKLRGAANKLLSLSEGEKMRGAVTASSGNHGTAFA
ncbi:MAG: pyridoxal-phosphate dependent enzyme, partial [Acidobacteria bacterium]|nr:pyridoxal-phosphate dependent enzyme [Acidobacteriota bacterium]